MGGSISDTYRRCRDCAQAVAGSAGVLARWNSLELTDGDERVTGAAFYSLDEWELRSALSSLAATGPTVAGSYLWQTSNSDDTDDSPTPTVIKISSNKNRCSHFAWLQELLHLIAEGVSRGVAKDISSGKCASPVFIVAGSCPNIMCGMQAAIFCCMDDGSPWTGETPKLDFWWIKPRRGEPQKLEPETINRHAHGKYRNKPGSSQHAYGPLAEKFRSGRNGDFVFGVDPESGRAYIEDVGACGVRERSRMLLYFVWQEDWSTMAARRKFMRGKLCYQRVNATGTEDSPQLFAREYEIRDGVTTINVDEEKLPSLLPPDSFQALSPNTRL